MGNKKRNTKIATARPNHGPRTSSTVPSSFWTSTSTATVQMVGKNHTTVHLHVSAKSREGKQLQKIVDNVGIKEVNADLDDYSLILEMGGKEYSFIDILHEMATPVSTLSFQVMAKILVKLEELEKDIKKLTNKPE